MSSVNNKVVFITGGARGIGADLARRLRRKNAKLVLTDIDAAPLADLAAELGEDSVLTAVADVRDLSAMQAAADRAVERFGGIDVVVANAGIASYGSVLQVDPEAFKRLIDINVNGVFHTVRATLPSIIDRRGYVLIVSSFAAYAAAPGLAPYHASKAAVEHFANALRLEVAYRGVDVGSAHMSWIDTPMVQDAKKDLGVHRDAVQAAQPARQDHQRGQMRRGVRQGHRGPQATGVRARLGRRVPLAAPGPVDAGRGAPDHGDGPDDPAEDGRRSGRARTLDQFAAGGTGAMTPMIQSLCCA